MLFVISAPSGAGKTTIIKELFKKNPNLKFSVSATTRSKRNDEKNGKDYYFLTDKEFDKKINSGEFLEWETVHSHRYGTLKSEVEKYLNSENHLLFDVDVKGALSLKKIYPEAFIIYIDVPFEQILKRLRKRNTETDKQIIERAERTELEIKEKNNFDYIIDNSDRPGGLEKAVKELNKIINKYYKGVKT